MIFADDVARAVVAASNSSLDGARVYNLHGECAPMSRVISLIEQNVPAARGKLTHTSTQMPFVTDLADFAYQTDLGPAPRTSLQDGVRLTIDEFRHLQRAKMLDTRELDERARQG